MKPLPDPRINAYRPDLAAAALRGVVSAQRYVEGTPHQVHSATATVKGEPESTARQTTELLFGETVTVYDRRAGWAWGQNGTDGYVGWIRLDDLSDRVHPPSHRLVALRSFIFPEPDIKAPPLAAISLASPLAVSAMRGAWCELATGGWVFARHLEPLPGAPADAVDTALRLVGVPYLWGGRSSLGIDCSGLVQVALAMAGIRAPRDSDQQQAAVGTVLDAEGADRRRGDLVFFPGHVGILLDPVTLLHATAHTLSVCLEPLDAVAARAGGILAVRRIG